LENKKINIVCFWWNDWCGTWGPAYVRKLYNDLQRYVTIPHNFYCFTDQPGLLDVPSIIFTPKYKWNLNKFEAYNPEHGLTGKILTLDIDILILDNIDDILDYTADFITCEAAYRKGKAGGSIVGTTVEYGMKNIWRSLVENTEQVTRKTKGSERYFFRKYLDNVQFFQHHYQGIYSYKKDGVPTDARIVRFHGRPRPHEVGYI